jgi:hypothetical protein
MFRPVLVSQSNGGLPIAGVGCVDGRTAAVAIGAVTCTGGSLPSIRFIAHHASAWSVGSFEASLSASSAAAAFGPMLPSAPAAQMRT